MRAAATARRSEETIDGGKRRMVGAGMRVIVRPPSNDLEVAKVMGPS